MKFFKRIGQLFGLALALLLIYMLMAWFQLFGSYEENGMPLSATVPVPAPVESGPGEQILFGDLHVHTTYSFDAFSQTVPNMGGQGSHPPSDACDFARFCSQLDFWSINDHAGGLSPWHWDTTRQAIRDCNAVAGDPENPDTVAFLGWEWTNISQTAESHWGHKNVIFKDQAQDQTPARPIAAKTGFVGIPKASGITGPLISAVAPLFDPASAEYHFRQGYYFDSAYNTPYCEEGKSVRDLPRECTEVTETPAGLYGKLEDWGYPALVIPHGNAWGLLVPPEASWVKDLTRGQHNPNIQKLIEVYSGHGNSEEYRPWRHTARDADGNAYCPGPSEGFLPACWRAGEIIRSRCLDSGESAETCDTRATQARQYYINGGGSGHYAVPATTDAPDEWLDAGHCQDCFMPTFMHRPMRTAQYAFALRQFDPDGKPIRFRFGMIGSSDTHRARPGTGYKAFARFGMTDVAGPISADHVGPLAPGPEPAAPIAREVVIDKVPLAHRTENERRSSYLTTGGLVAVHAGGRDRDSIWSALNDRSTYATSGPRILLWFDMIDSKGDVALPMGGELNKQARHAFA